MSFLKQDLILYRLKKSSITFEEAEALIEEGYWDGATNRLYYSCFYSVLALFAQDDITAFTHTGVRTEFFKHYIKSGILHKKYSKLYSDLMNKRQESDYDDFNDFSKEDILPLVAEVRDFMESIRKLIKV